MIHEEEDVMDIRLTPQQLQALDVGEGGLLRRTRSKSFVSAMHWYNARVRKAKTRFTTFAAKPTPAGICFALSFSFPTEKGIRSQLGR